MGRIGVATSPHPKGGRLPSGVGGREASANWRSEQSRTVGAVVTTVAGAARTTEVARNLPPASLPSAPRRSLCLVLPGAHSLLPQPRNLSNWLFFFALPCCSPLPSGPLLLIPCCLPLPLHRLGHLPCPISRSYISFNY